MDGTCQSGVFASMNGVVSATITDSGKVINVEVMSKYCAKIWKKNPHDPNCKNNFDGYNGKQELDGVLLFLKVL